jgi:hypothetical protein
LLLFLDEDFKVAPYILEVDLHAASGKESALTGSASWTFTSTSVIRRYLKASEGMSNEGFVGLSIGQEEQNDEVATMTLREWFVHSVELFVLHISIAMAI